MKVKQLIGLLFLLVINLTFALGQEATKAKKSPFYSANKGKVWVVSHRGDWRNAPENSLRAIEKCIAMGVDMVEVDIRMTKDKRIILMHDERIDRTTTGKGFVKDWTLDSLSRLYLRDGLGIKTGEKIPTLEEVLALCKDKILINLDKGFDLFPYCYKMAKESGTLDQIIFKSDKSFSEVLDIVGEHLDEINYMPVVNLDKPDSKTIIESFTNSYKPIAMELNYSQANGPEIGQFKALNEKGILVWNNSLWSNLNGGHQDDLADKDITVYDWYLKNHVHIIQTDRPALLINYLKSKGLH